MKQKTARQAFITRVNEYNKRVSVISQIRVDKVLMQIIISAMEEYATQSNQANGGEGKGAYREVLTKERAPEKAGRYFVSYGEGHIDSEYWGGNYWQDETCTPIYWLEKITPSIVSSKGREVEFAEWIGKHDYIQNQSNKLWYISDEDYTTSELFQLFQSSTKTKQP